MSTIIPADESVDHRRGVDHIGVSIAAIIHDGNGNLLLMKRSQNARDEKGKWDVCGGAVEFGESVDEAVRREIREELCTEALDLDFITAHENHREHDGSKTHWIILAHIARVDSDKVQIGEPHKIDEIGWFNLDNLPTPMHSEFGKNLAIIKQSGVFK